MNTSTRKRRHVKVEYNAENKAPSGHAEPSTSLTTSVPIKLEPVEENIIVKQEVQSDLVPTDGAATTGVGVRTDSFKPVNLDAVKSEVWQPPNWVEQLEGIREMRKNRDAPVDTMGCERCHDHDAIASVQRFVKVKKSALCLIVGLWQLPEGDHIVKINNCTVNWW